MTAAVDRQVIGPHLVAGAVGGVGDIEPSPGGHGVGELAAVVQLMVVAMKGMFNRFTAPEPKSCTKRLIPKPPRTTKPFRTVAAKPKRGSKLVQ